MSSASAVFSASSSKFRKNHLDGKRRSRPDIPFDLQILLAQGRDVFAILFQIFPNISFNLVKRFVELAGILPPDSHVRSSATATPRLWRPV